MAYMTFTDALMNAKRSANLRGSSFGAKDTRNIQSNYMGAGGGADRAGARMGARLNERSLEMQERNFADTLAEQKRQFAVTQAYWNSQRQQQKEAPFELPQEPPPPPGPGIAYSFDPTDPAVQRQIAIEPKGPEAPPGLMGSMPGSVMGDPNKGIAAVDPQDSLRPYAQGGIQYLQQNPDVATSGMDPWAHFTIFGYKEGRKWPGFA